MGNTPNIFRDGAVGFIDWLDGDALEQHRKQTRKSSEKPRDNKYHRARDDKNRGDAEQSSGLGKKTEPACEVIRMRAKSHWYARNARHNDDASKNPNQRRNVYVVATSNYNSMKRCFAYFVLYPGETADKKDALLLFYRHAAHENKLNCWIRYVRRSRRDLLRSLLFAQAFGLPAYLAASPTAAFTDVAGNDKKRTEPRPNLRHRLLRLCFR